MTSLFQEILDGFVTLTPGKLAILIMIGNENLKQLTNQDLQQGSLFQPFYSNMIVLKVTTVLEHAGTSQRNLDSNSRFVIEKLRFDTSDVEANTGSESSSGRAGDEHRQKGKIIQTERENPVPADNGFKGVG